MLMFTLGTASAPALAMSAPLMAAQSFGDYTSKYGPPIVAALLTLIIGWIVTKALTRALRGMLNRASVDPTLTGFFTNLAYLLLITIVVITALGKLGVPTASFVAIVGAAGLAIGFALQGSLANLAAGVMLIIFRPFKLGDYVEVAGTSGTVEASQVFATTLKTPDNKVIVVPNSNIIGGNIVNYSAKDVRRVDMVFGIGYDDDIKKARATLERILAADERVLDDPAPTIAVLELADSSVNLAVRPWVKTADYWGAYFGITEAVKQEFDAQGISIPFPQHDVHVRQVEAA
jgi:small conductance mechanosensitive channel